MKKSIFLFLFPLLFVAIIIACIPTGSHDIKGIKVTENFPVIDSNGKLIRYDTFSTRIYKYKNRVLYHGEYNFDSTVNGILLKSEKRDYFFVYKKSNLFGLFFDSNKKTYGKKSLVDSVIKKEWCNNLNFYQGYTESKLKLVSNNEKPDPGGVVQTYFFQGIKDSGLTGITYFWFSNKLNHLEYSFSKELDSIYKMKLYKIKIKNNSRYFKDYNFTLDPIEQYFTLEEITVNNKSEIMKYFKEQKNFFK